MSDPKRSKSNDPLHNALSSNDSLQQAFYPPHLNSSVYPQPVSLEPQLSSSSIKRNSSDEPILHPSSTPNNNQDQFFFIFQKLSTDLNLPEEIHGKLLQSDCPWRTEFSLQFKQELFHLFHTYQQAHPPHSFPLFFAIYHGLQDSRSLSHLWQSKLGSFDVPENRQVYDSVLKYLYSEWIQQNVPPQEAQIVLELLL